MDDVREAVYRRYPCLKEIEDERFALVLKDGMVIRNMRDPSLRIRLTAVAQNPWAIQYISEPNDLEQLTAVTGNVLTIQYIDKPTNAVIEHVLGQNNLVAVSLIESGAIERYIESLRK